MQLSVCTDLENAKDASKGPLVLEILQEFFLLEHFQQITAFRIKIPLYFEYLGLPSCNLHALLHFVVIPNLEEISFFIILLLETLEEFQVGLVVGKRLHLSGH